MEEEDFRGYLQSIKKPKTSIDSYIKRVRTFEDYLKTKDPPVSLREVTRENIEDFSYNWGREQGLNVYQYLWGIKFYFLFKDNANLYLTVDELKERVQLEKYRLRDFQDVNKEYVKKLGLLGIRTADQLLVKGLTPAMREELHESSGVPHDYLLELVKLSNLARIGGLKKKRGRLFYDAGLDTFEKIMVLNANELIEKLSEFIEKTGFNGKAPNLSEAEYTISMAKFLKRIIKN